MGKCLNTTVIGAPADEVWRGIRDFHELGWAAGVVTKCDVVGDVKGETVGAKRVLNDAFHETLLSLDDGERTLTYAITDGPGPVAKDAVKNYIGKVRVCPVTDTNEAFVEWTSSYESADPGAVGELCNPIYQALLGAMKKHFA